MLGFCLCGGSRGAIIDPKSKHYDEVRKTRNHKEMQSLQTNR